MEIKEKFNDIKATIKEKKEKLVEWKKEKKEKFLEWGLEHPTLYIILHAVYGYIIGFIVSLALLWATVKVLALFNTEEE